MSANLRYLLPREAEGEVGEDLHDSNLDSDGTYARLPKDRIELTDLEDLHDPNYDSEISDF